MIHIHPINLVRRQRREFSFSSLPLDKLSVLAASVAHVESKRLGASIEDAEDCSQDAAAIVLRGLRNFDPARGTDPRSFAAGVGKRHAHDNYRKRAAAHRRRRQMAESTDFESVELKASTDSDPVAIAINRERLERVLLAATSLRPEQRETLTLALADIPIKEQARRLNVTENTVMIRRSRLYDQLRKQLSHDEL
jgi:RNA polymerase sigma factor (sigma-70 family)